jgi:Na+-transporting methylmalonyl-CoA/oxaloacetate decarboxylase gamma subunit
VTTPEDMMRMGINILVAGLTIIFIFAIIWAVKTIITERMRA